MAPVDGNEPGAQGAVEGVDDPAGGRIVRLVGEIDISNADSLGANLDEIIGESCDRVVIDLVDLEFMDSSGIALLLRCAGRVGTLELRNPSNVVRRIIECTGLADVLHIEA
jgi:anti-sigma B factor antagonist